MSHSVQTHLPILIGILALSLLLSIFMIHRYVRYEEQTKHTEHFASQENLEGEEGLEGSEEDFEGSDEDFDDEEDFDGSEEGLEGSEEGFANIPGNQKKRKSLFGSLSDKVSGAAKAASDAVGSAASAVSKGARGLVRGALGGTAASRIKGRRKKGKRALSADDLETPTQEEKTEAAERLSKAADNLTANSLQKELDIMEEQVNKANMARDRSELNLATTKNFLEAETKQNSQLNKRIGDMSKTSAGKQNKCLTLDGEIRQLKKKLEVSKVERDSADNQIKQIRSQLESVQKNEPLEKKLQLQMTQLNQGKTAVEVKMVEIESRLSANLLKQNDLRNEIKTLQGMLAGQAAGRNASDREIIQLKNKLELERIAKRTAEANAKAFKDRLAVKGVVDKSQQNKLRLLKDQYVNIEERRKEALEREAKLKREQERCAKIEVVKKKDSEKIKELEGKAKKQAEEMSDMRVTIKRLKKAI